MPPHDDDLLVTDGIIRETHPPEGSTAFEKAIFYITPGNWVDKERAQVWAILAVAEALQR